MSEASKPAASPPPAVRTAPAAPSRPWLGVVAFVVVAAGLGAAAWWWLQAPEPPEIPLEHVEADVAAAIRTARQAVVDQPRLARAWGTLGLVLLAHDLAPEESLACFRQAERLEPRGVSWPYYQARVLVQQGKYEEALAKLKRAVALCDESGETDQAALVPRLYLAETLLAMGRPAEAEVLFREALDKDSRQVRAHFGLSILASSRQDWPGCRTHLEACQTNPQTRKRACAQLAAVCLRLDDKEASDRYRDLAARSPDDIAWTDPYVTAYAHLSQSKWGRHRHIERLEAEGRFKDAADLLRSMAEKSPEDFLTQLTLGRILLQIGDLEGADRALRKGRALDGGKLKAHYLLALVLHEKAKRHAADKTKARAYFKEAEECSRKALSLNRAFGFAHLSLGLALKGLGRREEALASLGEAVRCSPEFVETHLELAVLLAEEHRREARAAFDEAERLAAPGDTRVKDARRKFE